MLGLSIVHNVKMVIFPLKITENMRDLTEAELPESASGWQVEKLENRVAQEKFVSQACAKLSLSSVSCDIEVAGVEHEMPNPELLILPDREADNIVGLAVLSIAKSPLVYSIGPLVFFRWWGHKYQLYQGPICQRSDKESAIAELFDKLAKEISADGTIFLSTVQIHSPLHAQLTENSSRIWRQFFVLPWGEETTHCAIRWEGTCESYLKSLSAKHRYDLRHRRRSLFSDSDLKCSARRFFSVPEVEIFLRDAAQISNKSYQKRLGLGISPGSHTERAIRFAAEHENFLGHILYIDDQPVSFDYGFVFGQTLIMAETAYDPSWAARHVGAVLFFETLHDLERFKVPVRYLDLSVHPTTFKLRTTNEHRQVRNYYLFKRNFIGTIQYMTLSFTNETAIFMKFLVRQAIHLREVFKAWKAKQKRGPSHRAKGTTDQFG